MSNKVSNFVIDYSTLNIVLLAVRVGMDNRYNREYNKSPS